MVEIKKVDMRYKVISYPELQGNAVPVTNGQKSWSL